jgi:hypothetical protein
MPRKPSLPIYEGCASSNLASIPQQEVEAGVEAEPEAPGSPVYTQKLSIAGSDSVPEVHTETSQSDFDKDESPTSSPRNIRNALGRLVGIVVQTSQ